MYSSAVCNSCIWSGVVTQHKKVTFMSFGLLFILKMSNYGLYYQRVGRLFGWLLLCHKPNICANKRGFTREIDTWERERVKRIHRDAWFRHGLSPSWRHLVPPSWWHILCYSLEQSDVTLQTSRVTKYRLGWEKSAALYCLISLWHCTLWVTQRKLLSSECSLKTRPGYKTGEGIQSRREGEAVKKRVLRNLYRYLTAVLRAV